MKRNAKEGLVVKDAVVNRALCMIPFFLCFILREVKHFFPLALPKRKQTLTAHLVFSENFTGLPYHGYDPATKPMEGMDKFLSDHILVVISHN